MARYGGGDGGVSGYFGDQSGGGGGGSPLAAGFRRGWDFGSQIQEERKKQRDEQRALDDEQYLKDELGNLDPTMPAEEYNTALRRVYTRIKGGGAALLELGQKEQDDAKTLAAGLAKEKRTQAGKVELEGIKGGSTVEAARVRAEATQGGANARSQATIGAANLRAQIAAGNAKARADQLARDKAEAALEKALGARDYDTAEAINQQEGLKAEGLIAKHRKGSSVRRALDYVKDAPDEKYKGDFVKFADENGFEAAIKKFGPKGAPLPKSAKAGGAGTPARPSQYDAQVKSYIDGGMSPAEAKVQARIDLYGDRSQTDEGVRRQRAETGFPAPEAAGAPGAPGGTGDPLGVRPPTPPKDDPLGMR
jgi:hypothetical protein